MAAVNPARDSANAHLNPPAYKPPPSPAMTAPVASAYQALRFCSSFILVISFVICLHYNDGW
ncbi:MAG: hypothetical protein LUE22_00705 [Oscillospiraceae bacterium]|nr:hypothetical protein [Oscillospiraceae bacterium]